MSTPETAIKKNSGSHAAPAEAASGVPPLTVGNPAAAGSLAIDQSHLEEYVANTEASSSVVEVRRPPKGTFFTVPEEVGKPWQHRAFYFLLELEGRDPFVVAEAVAKAKRDEEDTIRPVLLARYVTMAGDEGLWPLKLDRPDGKSNAWNVSALNILELAAGGRWVRIVSMRKHYRHQLSRKKFDEVPPKFSERSLRELVDIAFKGRVVDRLDHEIWDALENGSTK
jgi:hypothetical protein